jgi:dihydrofolate synthase / folylpolyglutamate synthase
VTVEIGDALAWLDGHQNLEAMLADRRLAVPDLSRMRQLMDLMDDPQRHVPVLHLTGTNGKTSTARALTCLLAAKGLNVGTYTSPHLERINERLAVAGEPVDDAELAELLSSIADLEPLLDPGSHLTWFEILTAAAFRWFSDRPVDASVVEVGLGGRWDATNVADATVAVVTNIGLDHVEFLGPTLADVAAEKAGIVKPGSALVVGETRPELQAVFEAQGAATVWRRDEDFACERNLLAVGGRVIDLRTPGGEYRDVFLAVHGRHQGDNFVCALAAAEAFFGAPLEADLVAEAAATVRSPGRLEIVSRDPLCILDGAKNVDGAIAATAAIDEEFSDARSRVLVVGMLRGKDPGEMLRALGADRARVVVACPPPSPRAQPAAVVAAAARALGCPAEEAGSVPEALDRALAMADADDLILVTGSLYVVGAARTAFAARVHDGSLPGPWIGPS